MNDFDPDVIVKVGDDGDVDLIGGETVVEVARHGDGKWHFWNVRLGNERIGGTQSLSSPVSDWLEREYQAAMKGRAA